MASAWANFPPSPGTGAPGTYPQATPAFHPVQVRQTFGQPAPPSYNPSTMAQPYPPPAHIPPPPVQAAPRQKIEWPQSVRDYVQRCFDPSQMVADIPRSEIEQQLKLTITTATDNGSLTTTDWNSLPLPQHMIQQARAAARMAAASIANSSSNAPKKRKSGEMGGSVDEASSIPPPWRNTNNHNVLQERVTIKDRVDKRLQPEGTSKFQKNMEKRQRKFDGGYKSTYKSPSPDPTAGPVVGTCETLEKKYFRLTAAPIPSHVRPERVLRKTLELLKQKWRKESNYGYICDQFKSLRQDLTVQRITNDLTVDVYEIHARIALEKGDIGEYNQCQTQLRVLYARGLKGKSVEFKAYRILYFIHTTNRTALNDVLADLTIAEKEEPAIKHALDVRSSLALGNYHKFFRLYLDTPNMGAYLMDMFVVRERLAAMANICRAYKPDVKLRFVTEELGFESDADAVQFIVDYNGQHLLEERENGLCFLTAKAGDLFQQAKNAAFRKVDIKGQI